MPMLKHLIFIVLYIFLNLSPHLRALLHGPGDRQRGVGRVGQVRGADHGRQADGVHLRRLVSLLP